MGKKTRRSQPERGRALPAGARIAVNVYEAKTHFSELLRRVQAGDEVTIARDGAPIVRLLKVEDAPRARSWGGDQGKILLAPDFDELGPEWDAYTK